MVVEDMIIEEDMAKLEVDLDVLLVDEVQDKKRLLLTNFFAFLINNKNNKIIIYIFL